MGKRFIAGAVCPNCQQQDTLALWQHQPIEHVQCVACGHQMQQSEKGHSTPPVAEHQVIAIFTPE